MEMVMVMAMVIISDSCKSSNPEACMMPVVRSDDSIPFASVDIYQDTLPKGKVQDGTVNSPSGKPSSFATVERLLPAMDGLRHTRGVSSETFGVDA